MAFTEEQIRSAEIAQFAAAHDERAQVRLVAGPGTGKSRAIEERVRWLLNRGVRAPRIFVVSFTRAAVESLRYRIEEYCRQCEVLDAPAVNVRTLHSLALRILRSAGLLAAYPTDPMVMDQWELKNLFDTEFACAAGIAPARCETIRRYREAFWNTGEWSPVNYEAPDPPISDDELRAFSNFHSQRSQIYSCVLPGEIVRRCLECLEAGSLDPVRQSRMELLIVDEFQDFNPSDLALIDCLIEAGAITFVAGDDDQSVYSFRFASAEGIQQFRTKYPDAGDHQLEGCFRCAPSVLETALSVIAAYPLPNRIPKRLIALLGECEAPIRGTVCRWAFRSGVAEARAIAQSCRDLIAAGVPPRDIFVLISNRDVLAAPLVQAFDGAGVPYQPPISNLTDTPEWRLALTVLRIACDDGASDYIAHRSLLHFLPRVGIHTCHAIAGAVVHNNINFIDLFYRPLPGGALQTRARHAIDAARHITERLLAWQGTDSLEDRSPAIEEILMELHGDPAREAWLRHIGDLPREIHLRELRDYFWADDDEQRVLILKAVHERLDLPVPEQGLLPQRVQLMTMHGSKGLGAKVVFVPGLEEQILPGPKRRRYPGLVLEAARLLYMSVSRARVACILSYAENRLVYDKFSHHTCSRFVTCLGGRFAEPSDGLTPTEVGQIAAESGRL